NLQLSGACDLINRPVKGTKYRSVGRVHRDEYGNTEYDARQSQRPAKQMTSHVRPAQESKEHHCRRSSTTHPSRSDTVREHRAATSRSCVTINIVEPRRL